MAKFHLDRIRKKYGWTGGRYQALMALIIQTQSENIANRIGEIQRKKLDRVVRKLNKYGAQRIAVPDISEVLPAKSVHLRKGAERGKLLTDALRDQLTTGLRAAVLGYITGGKPTMQYAPGKAGRMDPGLVAQFGQHVAQVFAAYAKRDPELGGVPRNVATIATTEVTSVVNEIKHTYVQRLVSRNAGALGPRKKWIHHAERSKEPRPGHRATGGKVLPMAEAFRVPVYDRVGTIKSGPNKGRPRWKRTGDYVEMQHPHDPSAPISEVASCHCELDYTWEVAKHAAAKKT